MLTDNIQIGDLVYVISPKQEKPFPNQTRGVVFSKTEDGWFKIYVTWNNQKRVQSFPNWMLKKVLDFSAKTL
jgi:hypothetical protein